MLQTGPAFRTRFCPAKGDVNMFGGPFRRTFRCRRAGFSLTEAPPASRTATPHRSTASVRDKKMVLGPRCVAVRADHAAAVQREGWLRQFQPSGSPIRPVSGSPGAWRELPPYTLPRITANRFLTRISHTWSSTSPRNRLRSVAVTELAVASKAGGSIRREARLHLPVHAIDALAVLFNQPHCLQKERAADDVPTVVHPVDDQSASRHGHRGDGVANILRHAALEVELLMLEAPEQAPELVGCELPGNVTEPRDGVHDEKYYQIFSKKLSTWNVS